MIQRGANERVNLTGHIILTQEVNPNPLLEGKQSGKQQRRRFKKEKKEEGRFKISDRVRCGEAIDQELVLRGRPFISR